MHWLLHWRGLNLNLPHPATGQKSFSKRMTCSLKVSALSVLVVLLEISLEMYRKIGVVVLVIVGE